MPLESTITAAIKKSAEAAGWWCMKIHGGPHQLPGVPDLLCIKRGRAVWLEVKQPGKKATPLQRRRMEEITNRGGSPCYVVTDTNEATLYLCANDQERMACHAGCRRLRDGLEYR